MQLMPLPQPVESLGWPCLAEFSHAEGPQHCSEWGLSPREAFVWEPDRWVLVYIYIVEEEI